MGLRFARPLSTSNKRPTAWTTASASPTKDRTQAASVASPATHSTQSSAGSPGSGFTPRRLRLVTSQPRVTKRRATSRPT